MLIRRVTAHAFGPLVGESLELGDGMTVVYGANESAKSSWHAACYAALCGRRRGKGAQSIEERRFAELHRPWDGGDWVVSAEILLDDGRRVEMRHDLNGKVDCHAKDLVLGTDLSAEVIHDGAPDAAVWLGLDRQSFAATACVFQTKVLAVLGHADGLQAHLQKAATNAGADQTAARALDRLDTYRADEVGLDRANSTKPLRRAINSVELARRDLDAARLAHQDYQDHVVTAQQLRGRSDEADRRLRLHEAARAAEQARSLRATADEAIDLDRRLGGVPPESATATETTSHEVAVALSAWQTRPVAPRPRGEADVAAVGTVGPAVVADPPQWIAGDDELFDLARQLDLSTPSADPALAQRVATAQQRVAEAQRRAAIGVRWGVVAALLAVGAVAMVAMGDPIVGAVIAVGALLLGLVAMRRRLSGDRAAADQESRSAQLAEATAQSAAMAVTTARAEAVARCARLGLPADPARLREMARVRAGGAVLADRDDQWRQELARTDEVALARVLAAARLCGVVTDDVDVAVAALHRWKAERGVQAARADQDRQDWARLRALLDGRGLSDVVVVADRARDAAAEAGEGFAEAEIQAVSAGGSVGGGGASVGGVGAGGDGVGVNGVRGVDEAWLADLRRAARTASEAAVAAEESTKERSRTVVPVGEAEERLARAEAELARVRTLDETLTLTTRFLITAQERVHRDIAPVLADTLRMWLPTVTGGRYTDVIVDPGTLRVQVCGPSRRWRDADRLSFGTAEQVYLLLRIALAGLLAAPGVRCPLLLDDVTVHADAVRTKQILELLLDAAQERQIVLFTQQEQVRDWARTRLAGNGSAQRPVLREIPSLTVV